VIKVRPLRSKSIISCFFGKIFRLESYRMESRVQIA
jgi:hypothetical protein